MENVIDKTKTKSEHKWASGGVSGYPLTHPIVGQGRFFHTFKHFIHLVEQDADKFAHVFAIIANWGIGKSRLGYELISQINESSKGWTVRESSGNLADAELFDSDAEQSHYLGLYIRYSQIANEYHNADNWFAYGLYKSLLPLARGSFDSSIQGAIAREAYDRLFALGFDEKELAARLEVEKNHTDEDLYEDPELASRLCQAAYAYLQNFGIKYVLIVLDELETAAEASTYGMEEGDLKRLDGRAIKLIGKAIKEEDPRRKLPWLRYVALCSPAVGDELREIKSTARRFELVDLSQNAFADVSDFVKELIAEGRLGEYPEGLVEAAYAMSGGNFGWFNVIMANVDEVLRTWQASGNQTPLTIGNIFEATLKSSSRMRDYVLDQNAISELKLNADLKTSARELLYGQLPVALSRFSGEEISALLDVRNEYDEPVTVRFRRVEWDDLESSDALRKAKFVRDNEIWKYAGVDQEVDLNQVLSNLGTYAIHESQTATAGKRVFLIPLRQSDFIQLINLLYPHPLAEDIARALWRHHIGDEDLSDEMATHIGPSVAMLGRLNLRYRRQNQNALIFRFPEENDALDAALARVKKQTLEERGTQILTGALRVLDSNWQYDAVDPGFRDAPPAIITQPLKTGGRTGGLISFKSLHLHPKGRLVLAWVRSIEDLKQLCSQISQQFSKEGRTPVLAFTSSLALREKFNNTAIPELREARNYLLLYQLSSSEEFILHQLGLPTSAWNNFRFEGLTQFSTQFHNRVQSLLRPLQDEINKWRGRLHQKGLIAMPLRVSGTLSERERESLIEAWRYLLTKPEESRGLRELAEPESRVDVQEILALLPKLGISAAARSAGFTDNERAMLFDSLDQNATALLPPLLVRLDERWLSQKKDWNFRVAQRELFWGAVWEGAKPPEVFQEWMLLAQKLGFAKPPVMPEGREKVYPARELDELGSRITEAENWLNVKYPNIVKKMKDVFGEGRVSDSFEPLKNASGAKIIKPGTKTNNAKAKLDDAKDNLAKLEDLEHNQFPAAKNLEEQARVLTESAMHRLAILQNVNWVYDRDEFERSKPDENIRTLNFDDDNEPLWRRIQRAEHYIKFLYDQKDRIVQFDDLGNIVGGKVLDLQNEIRQSIENLPGFPDKLFTRSLDKIAHIITGAIGIGEKFGSTQNKQQTEAGTLGHALRDLRIADATNRLAQLADEVGIDIESRAELKFEEIDGQIISGFRRLKQSYEQISDSLLEAQSDLDKLSVVLIDAPADFKYPSDVKTLDQLLNMVLDIKETIEEIGEEDVERLRMQFDAPAKLGNFQPLMNEAGNLYREPVNALRRLRGEIVSIENAVSGYLSGLLQEKDVREIENALNVLRRTRSQPPLKNLDMNDLQSAGSLKAALGLLQERREDWTRQGNEILEKTGIKFDRWARIAAALDESGDPQLESEEADALVKHGFLVRTYRFGGGGV